jgi:phage FluMu protein Com
MRCLCGSLLARLVDDHVELKCKRCKRMMMVPLSGMPRSSRQGDTTRHCDAK